MKKPILIILGVICLGVGISIASYKINSQVKEQYEINVGGIFEEGITRSINVESMNFDEEKAVELISTNVEKIFNENEEISRFCNEPIVDIEQRNKSEYVVILKSPYKKLAYPITFKKAVIIESNLIRVEE